MAKKEKYYDIHEFLEGLREAEGLPENIATETQLWDEILKKEAYLMHDQFFPLIYEIHGKQYKKGTPIKPLATEYAVERSKTKEITSIRADITVLVGEQDIYHFECEISNDGSMVLRMFEYDVHIALEYHSFVLDDSQGKNSKSRKKGDNGRKSPSLVLKFPRSAVLYLQDNRNIPSNLTCEVQFPDGGSYKYKVPTLRIQSYSLEDIQKKHLSLLIPFLPLRFRKRLSPKRKKGKMEKGELTSFYQEVILILDKEVTGGYLSEKNRKTILSLLGKSMVRVFHKDKSLLEEVIRVTEPILELEYEKYERYLTQYYEQKFEEWKNKALSQRDEALFQKDEELSQKDEELSQKEKEIAELKRRLWLMENPGRNK